MFLQADKNKNGRIDFDEFVDMMLPGQLVVKLQKIM
jgi:Ca2+-binding EF-hand superfamily protein